MNLKKKKGSKQQIKQALFVSSHVLYICRCIQNIYTAAETKSEICLETSTQECGNKIIQINKFYSFSLCWGLSIYNEPLNKHGNNRRTSLSPSLVKTSGKAQSTHLRAERIWVHHRFQDCRGSFFTLRLVSFRNFFSEPEDMYSVMKTTCNGCIDKWNGNRLHKYKGKVAFGVCPKKDIEHMLSDPFCMCN